MLRLIRFKEKNSIITNSLYLITLVLFTVILYFSKGVSGNRNAFYFIVWVTFMVEVFRFSLFNLHHFYARDSNYSLTKAQTSNFRGNMQLLSVNVNQFIKCNIIYTFIRLFPFILVTILFEQSIALLVMMGLFLIIFLLKAYFGPLHTYLLSIRVESYINNRENTKEDRIEELDKKFKEIYDGFSYKKYRVYYRLFMTSYFMIMFYFFGYMYPIFPEWMQYNSPIPIALITSGLVILLVYGIYLNRLERKSDYELHQE